uniref:WW domain-containing protein n=1 Tax=Panagrolaimus sp. ES5 TaxID=591445 RepID=A0AC34GDZ5_9BILA
MPLPPALLAKLQKRGIVAQPQAQTPQIEVYAEHQKEEEDDEEETQNRGGAPGCPNRWNEFHQCTEFCYDHWREGGSEDTLPAVYLARRKEWQRKYPLAENWKEIYDAGVRRYYYWNFYTDEVSWFPPKHPRAIITISGPQAAAMFYDELKKVQAAAAKTQSKQKGNKRRNNDDRNERQQQKSERDPMLRRDGDSDEEPELSERDKLKRARRRGIDPMDPAAYGDNVAV